MKVEFREGWIAATRLMATMVDSGMTVTQAVEAVREAAGVDPRPINGSSRFNWEEYLEEAHPEYYCECIVEILKTWEAYRKETKRTAWAKKTWMANLKKWSESWTPERLQNAIKHTIEHGWQGIFEPQKGRGQQPSRLPQQRGPSEKPRRADSI